MNSFRLTAVANLARNPELSTKGDLTFARFCLVGNDRPLKAGTIRRRRSLQASSF